VLMECTDGMLPCSGPTLKATAMYIDGADSHFNRNIVACTHVGFVNANGDNFYHQNHIWTNCRPPQEDNGRGDFNQAGMVVTGGTPQIDGGAMDNCHLRFTSFRGAIVTNMHFNGASLLILDAWQPQPGHAYHAPKLPVSGDTRCQYWTGSMCSIRITNNRFGCRGSQPSNNGNRSSCGTIVTNYTPPAAQQIDISGNAWDNASTAVCSHMKNCIGPQCAGLFGTCSERGPDSGSMNPLDVRWLEAADALCKARGFSLSSLKQLSPSERLAALADEGTITALQRARILAALEHLEERPETVEFTWRTAEPD
jgi:hypothetical protein